jgi:hypothetical protein
MSQLKRAWNCWNCCLGMGDWPRIQINNYEKGKVKNDWAFAELLTCCANDIYFSIFENSVTEMLSEEDFLVEMILFQVMNPDQVQVDPTQERIDGKNIGRQGDGSKIMGD